MRARQISTYHLCPTSVDYRSTCTPSQQFFHSGSVNKHPSATLVLSAERDALKALTIEKLACPVNNPSRYCCAMSSGVRHRLSPSPDTQVFLEWHWSAWENIILIIFSRSAVISDQCKIRGETTMGDGANLAALINGPTRRQAIIGVVGAFAGLALGSSGVWAGDEDGISHTADSIHQEPEVVTITSGTPTFQQAQPRLCC